MEAVFPLIMILISFAGFLVLGLLLLVILAAKKYACKGPTHATPQAQADWSAWTPGLIDTGSAVTASQDYSSIQSHDAHHHNHIQQHDAGHHHTHTHQDTGHHTGGVETEAHHSSDAGSSGGDTGGGGSSGGE